MATTTGYVFAVQIDASNTTACAQIGMTPINLELLAVVPSASDAQVTSAMKHSIIDALSEALVSQRVVTADHDDADGLIFQLSFAFNS
jgi:hypothetical protein